MNEKSNNNSKNKAGSNADPWGTPEVTGGGFECDPLTETTCDRFFHKGIYPTRTFPSNTIIIEVETINDDERQNQKPF